MAIKLVGCAVTAAGKMLSLGACLVALQQGSIFAQSPKDDFAKNLGAALRGTVEDSGDPKAIRQYNALGRLAEAIERTNNPKSTKKFTPIPVPKIQSNPLSSAPKGNPQPNTNQFRPVYPSSGLPGAYVPNPTLHYKPTVYPKSGGFYPNGSSKGYASTPYGSKAHSRK